MKTRNEILHLLSTVQEDVPQMKDVINRMIAEVEPSRCEPCEKGAKKK